MKRHGFYVGDGVCTCVSLPSMCEVELIPPITSVSASSEKVYIMLFVKLVC